MKAFTAWLIADEAERAGIEVTVQKDYSGRGMYGKTTVAIVFDGGLGDLLAPVAAASARLARAEGGPFALDAFKADVPDDVLGDEDPCLDEFLDDLRGFRTDNMGRGTVAY